MKKLITMTLASVLVASAAYGQGQVSFKNYFGNVNTDPAVFASGGTTKLQGAQYLVGLYAGPTSGSEAQIATTPFLTAAAAAGFFQAGTVSIPTVAGGATAFLTINVWDTTLNGTTTGATWAQALAYHAANPGIANIEGQSTEFSLVPGAPPNPPTFLVPGLTSFSMNAVPEPSTFALAGLGAAALMIFRRRK
jgi:hypothetical protein